MSLTAADSTVVTLTDQEWAEAALVGAERNREAESRGYRQGDGYESPNALANHQQGARAELATAKLYGMRWDATINGYSKVPDLLCCEVRSTSPLRPYLRIKRRDSPGKRSWAFILVTYLGGKTFRIEGWIYGYEAMIDEYLDPEPYSLNDKWRVPLEALHPPFTLQYTLERLSEVREAEMKKGPARQEAVNQHSSSAGGRNG